jgi:hypothetical protein
MSAKVAHNKPPPKLRGKLYISRKNNNGGDRRSQESECKSCNQPSETTAEIVARETGVSPRTIANDAAYAEAAS